MEIAVFLRVGESKTVLDSGFQAVNSGFQVQDSSVSQWNLDSGFQSLAGFRIPQANISRIPLPEASLLISTLRSQTD